MSETARARASRVVSVRSHVSRCAVLLCEGPQCAVSQFARRFTRAGDSLPAHTGDSTGGWSGRWRTRFLRRGCARTWCARFHDALVCTLRVTLRALSE